MLTPYDPTPPGEPRHVIVVGGGLAGLTAAVYASRAGGRVTLLDARRRLGGRARTHEVGTAQFNEGPHALYRGTVGAEVLAELDVRYTGGRPTSRVWAEFDGGISLVPTTATDVLRPTGLSRPALARVGSLIAVPGRRPAGAGASMQEWIEDSTRMVDARRALRMLCRVATYCDDLDHISADAAVAQLRAAASRGVLYLDGGWSRLVDGLTARALDLGVEIRREAKADRVESGAPLHVGVGTGAPLRVGVGADSLAADAVVIAGGGPHDAARLLGDSSPAATEWARSAQPVVATSLDLHLARLPRPERRLVFGLDTPLYFSAHTPSAQLCDEGEVVHVMRYGPTSDSARAELEAFCDRAQPGWRDEVRAERFGRSLVVAHDRPRPGAGLAGRAGVAVPEVPGVFVAGDWVGGEGMLADASLASGRAAGRLAARVRAGVPV